MNIIKLIRLQHLNSLFVIKQRYEQSFKRWKMNNNSFFSLKISIILHISVSISYLQPTQYDIKQIPLKISSHKTQLLNSPIEIFH